MIVSVRKIAILSLLAASACEVTVNDGNDNGAAANGAAVNGAAPAAPADQTQNAQQPPASQISNDARQQFQDLRFVVDISDRKLRLMQGDRKVEEHDVAVGSERWPTPTGSWRIHRVDMNPEWNPPKDEEWAEDREPKAAGAPDNPMGRARLVYRMPNTIHGTDNRQSLGTASSHGSIRVANDVVLRLAEMLLRAGGAWEGPDWFRQMAENRSREVQIDLRHPVPIEVQD